MAMEEMGSRIVGDYKIGPNKIGSGSFSDVWMGHHRRDGVEVAVKEIDKRKLSSNVQGSLLKEITILRQVSHPNIVKLHQAIQTEDKIYLILEYCTGGDLAAYIHRHGRVSESVARHFMRQIASGLQVLRENNLIHRDLKPQLTAGLNLDSFSVELVTFAVWKEALQVCNFWVSSTTIADSLNSLASDSSHQKDDQSPLNLSEGLDFKNPLSVCSWVERGFILAYNRAEKISNSLQKSYGDLQMPDAMGIIFQTALSAGKSGGVLSGILSLSLTRTSQSKAPMLHNIPNCSTPI